MTTLSISFEKDYTNKKIIVTSKFDTPSGIIWEAFTNPTILDKWFAPEPYRAVTQIMEFKEGGRWLYYMLSPEGKKYWSTSVFTSIRDHKSFEASDAFCDEQGVIDTNLPQMTWQYNFLEENGKTLVVATITASDEKSMKQLLEMGFEEGYKTGLNQLQQLLNETKNSQ